MKKYVHKFGKKCRDILSVKMIDKNLLYNEREEEQEQVVLPPTPIVTKTVNSRSRKRCHEQPSHSSSQHGESNKKRKMKECHEYIVKNLRRSIKLADFPEENNHTEEKEQASPN
jgi:hypothetical protein